MIIESLSAENIHEAIRLVHSVFPDDAAQKDTPGSAYWASLEPERYKDFWKRNNTQLLLYFVVLEEITRALVGVTGFYRFNSDPPERIWLGWYCVDLKYRNEGYGKKILEWTMKKAREMGYLKLRLYTSDDPNEAAAKRLYEKLGFKLVDKNLTVQPHLFYFEKVL